MSTDKTNNKKFSNPKAGSKIPKGKSAFYAMRTENKKADTNKNNQKFEDEKNTQSYSKPVNLSKKAKLKKVANKNLSISFVPSKNNEVFDYETAISKKIGHKVQKQNNIQSSQRINPVQNSHRIKEENFKDSSNNNVANNGYMSTFIKNNNSINTNRNNAPKSSATKSTTAKTSAPKTKTSKTNTKIATKKIAQNKQFNRNKNNSNVKNFSKQYKNSEFAKLSKSNIANKKNIKHRFIDMHYKKIAILLILILIAGLGYWVQKKYLSSSVNAKSKSQVIAQADKKKYPKKTPDCAMGDLVLNVFMPQNQLGVGKGGDLGISVTNNSNKTCLAQAGSKKIGVRIMSGDQKIWDSVACPVTSKKNPLLLRSGQSWKGTIPWDGFIRDGKCVKTSVAKPGTYKLLGVKNGDLLDKFFAFSISQ